MKETQIETKRVYEGKIIRVRVDQAEMMGKTVMREVVEHPGGVAILAMNDAGKVLCVQQYRYAQGKEMLEVPAGKLEYHEDPLVTGKRELREETGYEAKNWVFLGEFIPTGAYLEEKIWMYYADQLHFVGQNFDEDEFIEISQLSLEELKQKILDQSLIDGKTMTMVLKVDLMKRQGLL